MNDLRRYLVDEFVEDFRNGRLTRREALKLLAGLAGMGLASEVLDAHAQGRAQPAAAPAPAASAGAAAARVPADDLSIAAGPVRFPGEGAQLTGYLARPAKPGTFPIVLVCHENRGLTPHIEDVVRRLGKAGYVGLAVDLLSREGGTAQVSDPDHIPGLLGNAPPERHVRDFQSGLAYAKAQPFARADRVGMVGFCFGGGVTWRVTAAVPELRAAVPFYGVPVQAGDVPRINAAVLAIYAGRDDRINQTAPAIEAAMQQNGKAFRKIVYPEVEHAFHNDTSARYNADAARAAWEQTLAWFARTLQGA